MIFREGDVADRFYLIETGNVILESFPPHIWTFSARAAEPTTAIFFYGETLREYCERDHSLGYELLKRLSLLIHQRLQAARNTMPTIHHRTDILPLVRLSPFMDPKLEPYPGADDDRQYCERAG